MSRDDAEGKKRGRGPRFLPPTKPTHALTDEELMRSMHDAAWGIQSQLYLLVALLKRISGESPHSTGRDEPQ